jgi:uncharacterized membrane protein
MLYLQNDYYKTFKAIPLAILGLAVVVLISTLIFHWAGYQASLSPERNGTGQFGAVLIVILGLAVFIVGTVAIWYGLYSYFLSVRDMMPLQEHIYDKNSYQFKGDDLYVLQNLFGFKVWVICDNIKIEDSRAFRGYRYPTTAEEFIDAKIKYVVDNPDEGKFTV